MSRRAERIVLIVFDYMGYADIAPFGVSEIRTPNIHRLADQGTCFTDFYAPSSICSPSRAALLMGRYPKHIGIELNVEPDGPGLKASDASLARRLRNAGYATALYGKWHVGHAAEESPNAHGFDDFLGFLDWNVDYYSHKTTDGADALYHNDKVVAQPGYSTDLFTQTSVDFIETNARNPFFLYLAYNAMLPPYTPPGLDGRPEEWDQWVKRPRADYVAAVEHLDAGVGRVLDALEAQGLAEDTLVLLTYDHGGGTMGTKGPFFHGFGTLWEGGIRVPMILRWPGIVAAGAETDRPAILMDATATLLAAGLDPAPDADGVSLLEAGPEPERPLYWRFEFPGEGEHWRARAQRAVRRGRWKYLWDGGYECLYDLAADPGERDDLGYRHPDLLAELRTLSESDW